MWFIIQWKQWFIKWMFQVPGMYFLLLAQSHTMMSSSMWTVQRGLHVFLIAEIMYSCLAWAQKSEVNRVLADALKSRQDYQDVSDDSHICSFAEWAC